MSNKIYLFNNIHDLANHLAEDFKSAVDLKADAGGVLTVALSGGHTPKAFFEVLSKPPYKETINWENVVLFWGDERCVPPDDDQSNFKMTELSLLANVEIPASNIHRVLGEEPPEEEAVRYEAEIKDIIPSGEHGFPEFDWIFLGMGADGHTASLFPGAATLQVKDKICVVAEHPETGQKRISVTLPVLNNAARVSFLIVGEEKAPVLKEILECKPQNLSYPASMVHPAHGVLEWYLDRAAAGDSV